MAELASQSIPEERNNLSYRMQQAIKRILDMFLAGSGLILFSPLIAIIALAIRLDSPGPVIYKHKRVGKDGQPFDLYKFRSMITGGDDSGYLQYLEELIESSKNGQGKPYRKMVDDPRVTRVGRLLRQYYLDELPQLWNIFTGDMSLVGPRPHVQIEVENYTPEQRRRLAVKPGATGIWQVYGKCDCSFGDLLELDLEYIDHWSLALDIQLIWQTGMIMLRGGEGSWTRMSKSVLQKPRK